MHSDSYFAIGATHNVCQDYAMHGSTEEGKAFAIVSDGCSGSPNTDFGSRFMAKAMQWALHHRPIEAAVNPGLDLFVWAVSHAQQMASTCNMEEASLDATVLVAVEAKVENREGVWVGVSGDGVIAARRRGPVGQAPYDYHLIDFPSGYPAYASYMLDVVRMREFVQHTEGGLADIHFFDGFSGAKTHSQHRFYTLDNNNNWFTPFFWFFDKEEYDTVALLSDGVGSFVQSDEAGRRQLVPLDSILTDVMDFKNLKGEFVVRRAKKFLSKTCQEKRWAHHDDFSMAVIALDD